MKKVISIFLSILMIVALLPGKTYAARDGVKAIQFVTQASEIPPGGQTGSIWFGNYRQSIDRNRNAQPEPVKWRVLETTADQLLLLSDQNLDARSYHSSAANVSWDDSGLRAWLNDPESGFIRNALSEHEAASLLNADLPDPDPGKFRAETAGNPFFLLSAAEAGNPEYGFTDDASRVSADTAFAAVQGGSGGWWLCDPGSADSSAAFVDQDGAVHDDGLDVTTVSGVRPAARLDRSAVLFFSAATGGKDSDPNAPGTLQKVGNYTGTEWKLTLRDETRAFAVSENEVSGANGQSILLNYTGATVYDPQTAPNEYISAMLVDSNYSPLYYGRLIQPAAETGKISITIPSFDELLPGSYYLLLFSEQYNGDYMTDLASPFSVLTLTVTGPEYTIKFFHEDGTLLQTISVPYGETPVYTGPTPTKPGTEQYSYTFEGWAPELAPVTGDADYTAVFTQKTAEYLISFVNRNGEVLQSGYLPYGSMPTYDGPSPSIPDTAKYTYAFFGWSPEIVPVTGNATYTAVYTSTLCRYSITFLNEDGTELQRTEYAYDEMPVYNGDLPFKEPTSDLQYTFAGWTPEIVPVIGSAAYTAVFTGSPREYTIRFVNDDLTELQVSMVAYGQTPVYEGVTPTKPSSSEHSYIFADWSPVVTPVDHDTTYVATFKETELVTYSVTQGANGGWTKGGLGSYSITVKRSPKDAECFEHYLETLIDGKQVPAYTGSSSNVVTLSADTLNGLGIGPHTITVKFNDGSVSTTLSVGTHSSGGSGYEKGGSPRTDGEKRFDFWIILAMVLGLGLGVTSVIMLKRRRKTN